MKYLSKAIHRFVKSENQVQNQDLRLKKVKELQKSITHTVWVKYYESLTVDKQTVDSKNKVKSFADKVFLPKSWHWSLKVKTVAKTFAISKCNKIIISRPLCKYWIRFSPKWWRQQANCLPEIKTWNSILKFGRNKFTCQWEFSGWTVVVSVREFQRVSCPYHGLRSPRISHLQQSCPCWLFYIIQPVPSNLEVPMRMINSKVNSSFKNRLCSIVYPMHTLLLVIVLEIRLSRFPMPWFSNDQHHSCAKYRDISGHKITERWQFTLVVFDV